MNKKLLEILRNKNNELKQLTDERNQIEVLKGELELELAKEEATKNLLVSQNKNYDEQIEKIKISRLYIRVCTTIFNIFLIWAAICSFFNLLTLVSLISLISIPVMTIIYIVAIANDVKFLKNNKTRFFKKLKKMNNNKINDIDNKLETLKEQLQNIVINYNVCTRNIEKQELAFEKLLVPNEIKESEELDKKPLTK